MMGRQSTHTHIRHSHGADVETKSKTTLSNTIGDPALKFLNPNRVPRIQLIRLDSDSAAGETNNLIRSSTPEPAFSPRLVVRIPKNQLRGRGRSRKKENMGSSVGNQEVVLLESEPESDHMDIEEIIQESESEDPCLPHVEGAARDFPVSKQLIKSDDGLQVFMKPTQTQMTSAEFEAAARKSRAKRLAYLLEQSETFSQFVKSKSKPAKTDKSKSSRASSSKKRKSAADRAENNESEQEEEHYNDAFTRSPAYIKNGTMRDYQIQGLNWLISLYHNSISGILADEMGLGKTIQTVALLGYLRSHLGIRGPHLIVAPKSTVRNWMNEFGKWCPSIKTICILGNKEERAEFFKAVFKPRNWNVCITSYEVLNIEIGYLKRVKWIYVVIDEAQRIKNENALLSKNVRRLKSTNRLLLTGTPLQNNLHELWALLNFLLPDLFDSAGDFDTWFDTNDCLGNEMIVNKLHGILNPFLLRRVKADVEKSLLPKKELKVYVELSQMQKEMYRKILLGELEILNGYGVLGKSHLSNTLMQLRKLCNHPYLFPGAEPRIDGMFKTDMHLVTNCGKLLVLDKLLAKLKAEGSRVLLFSQFTTLLDILEDYCFFRGHKYARLDGNTSYDDRQDSIDEFNTDGSEVFLFLLSTRAGGLGINLASADVVILYDSDWNPQVDLQAMDRSHRIGQKKQVRVFRLVTSGTVEEKIVERADVKLHLDRIVIQQGRLVDRGNNAPSKLDMEAMIRFGAEKILACNDSDDGVTDESIDAILARSKEKTRDLENRLGSLGESALRKFEVESKPGPLSLGPGSGYSEFEGKDYRKIKAKKKNEDVEILEPRIRNLTSYANPSPSSRSSFSTPVAVSRRKDESAFAIDMDKIMKLKPNKVHDFQFCSPRLVELYYQELDYFDKKTNSEYKASYQQDEALENWDNKRQQERSAPLTPAEQSEKEELSNEGFFDWTEGSARSYLKALKFRDNPDEMPVIPDDFPQRLESQFFRYHYAFIERHHELCNFHRILKTYNLSQSIPSAVARWTNAIRWKVSQYKKPAEQLEIKYDPPSWLGQRFRPKHDRQLVLLAFRLGFEKNPFDKMVKKIETFPTQYGLFLRTRSVSEIHSRCVLLLQLIEKEMRASAMIVDPNVLDTVETKAGAGSAVDYANDSYETACTVGPDVSPLDDKKENYLDFPDDEVVDVTPMEYSPSPDAGPKKQSTKTKTRTSPMTAQRGRERSSRVSKRVLTETGRGPRRPPKVPKQVLTETENEESDSEDD